jgi:GntR family transcriptional regulator/MocR family aminotransferase
MPELRVIPSAAGLHVTALLRAGDPAAVLRAAERAGVVVDDLAAYCQPSTTQAGFVFGFGAIKAELIGAGLEIFARLLRTP